MPSDLVSDLTKHLQAHDAVAAAWLFGSLAENAARPDSDIDVAVLGPSPLTRSEKKELIETLARLSGRPVDLVDLQTERGPIVGTVLKTGHKLFCQNPALHGDILTRYLSDQTDWAPYRRRILETRRHEWLED